MDRRVVQIGQRIQWDITIVTRAGQDNTRVKNNRVTPTGQDNRRGHNNRVTRAGQSSSRGHNNKNNFLYIAVM